MFSEKKAKETKRTQVVHTLAIILYSQGTSEPSASPAIAPAPPAQHSLGNTTTAWEDFSFANMLTLVLPDLNFQSSNEGRGNGKN